MIRRDLAEVLAIEHASFDFPWCEEDFLSHLRQQDIIGMVAEHGERVVGFMVYRLCKAKLDIVNFAVDPEHRRSGVGRQMVEKLLGKLSIHRRTSLHLTCQESHTSAHLFWHAMGFTATEVVRGAFGSGDGDTEDGYRFVYSLDVPEEVVDVQAS